MSLELSHVQDSAVRPQEARRSERAETCCHDGSQIPHLIEGEIFHHNWFQETISAGWIPSTSPDSALLYFKVLILFDLVKDRAPDRHLPGAMGRQNVISCNGFAHTLGWKLPSIVLCQDR